MQKRLLSVVFLLAFLAGPVAAQNSSKAATDEVNGAASWQKFAPEGIGFSVLMPGKPVVSEQPVDTDSGKLINHIHSSNLDGVYYMLIYSDFPTPVSDPTLIERMLDGAREQGLLAIRGVLKDEKVIKLGNNAGRQWLVAVPGGNTVHVRAYWVTQRLYQLLVLTTDPPEKPTHQTEVLRFLDSFSVN
jgi:hypothetical protein